MPIRIYSSPQPIAVLPPWEGNVGPFTHVIGHSVLGHFFLWSEASGEFGVLYPLQKSFKNYGVFASQDAFVDEVLESPSFQAAVLPPDLISAIEARIGSAEGMHVYYPVPYPFLGGGGAASTYDKGDALVFAYIAGNAHGLFSTP
jgi:hypothetical protein